MIKKSGTFVFSDKDKLIEMLALRRSGWTFESLAELYSCDRSSLRYQCRKYQIFPHKTRFHFNPHSLEVFDPKRIITSVLIEVYPIDTQWTIIDGEKINKGKSYAEYLESLSPYRKH